MIQNPLIVKAFKSGYIPELDICDCGSTTYGFIIETINIFYKKMRWIKCGGCDKTITLENVIIEEI